MLINKYELFFDLKVKRVIELEDLLLFCMFLFCLFGKLEEKYF